MLEAAFATIASSFSQALGGPYHPAIARWSGAPVLDAGGSIASPGTPAEVPCRVQVDRVTEAMRLSDGYRDKDMRLIVLAEGLSRPIDTNAKVEVTAGPHVGIWSIASAALDPAGIAYDCLGRRA